MFAHEEIKKVVEFQLSFLASDFSVPKQEFVEKEPPADIVEAVHAYGEAAMKDGYLQRPTRFRTRRKDGRRRSRHLRTLCRHLSGQSADDVAEVTQKMIKEIVRHMIAVDKIRPDGRRVDEVRPVSCEVGLFASALTARACLPAARRRSLSFCTLAPLSECQHIDGVGLETDRRYMHHYNFPSFCVGETKSSRGPGPS
jgi:polyribonucleotide nucleotidyltransferase